MRRIKFSRDFYLTGEKNYRKLVREGIDAEVYVREYEAGGQMRYSAVCFGGKRSAPDQNYYYLTEEARDKAVEDYFAGQKARAEYRAKVKQERIDQARELKVGDLLYTSWGYDQTNVDFYQVDFYQVAELVGKKSVKIRSISGRTVSESVGSERVVPVKDAFLERGQFIDEQNRPN